MMMESPTDSNTCTNPPCTSGILAEYELTQTLIDTSEALGRDLSQAIQMYLKMKQELEQVQRERFLTQQALLATQCSQSIVTMRLENIAKNENIPYDSANKGDDDEGRDADVLDENHDTEFEIDEEDPLDDPYTDAEDDEAVSIANPAAGLEEEIRRILPAHCQSLGFGHLGDMDECILEWQISFQLLNEQCERQVQACQDDVQRLNERIETMKAMDPMTPDIEEAIRQTQKRLERLMNTVECFPTQSRFEALQRDVEVSRQSEMRVIQQYTMAVEELDAARRREEELIQRLAQRRPGLPLRPRREIPTIRFTLYTKRKLQRLFKLDQSSRKHHEMPPTRQDMEQSSSPVSLYLSSEASSTPEASCTVEEIMMDIVQVDSMDDEPIFVSDSEEDDKWSSATNDNDLGPKMLTRISPIHTSLYPASDETFTSETTESITNSTSGTPSPPKKIIKGGTTDSIRKIHENDFDNGNNNNTWGSWWYKTKMLLSMQ